MRTRMKLAAGLWILPFIILLSLISVSAQKRDNLTEKEDNQVREARELDLRIKVFVKVIDRRWLALSNPNVAQIKEIQKDIDSWGEIRTGQTAELFFDIDQTISEAIAKLDDTAEREIKNPLFGKAVRLLAEACQKWLPQLNAALEKAADDREKALLFNSIESCNQVIEASARVPKVEKKN